MSGGVVTVYGELYGGNVQGGMAYPLEQDFAGFDITINGQPINKLTAFSAMFADNIPTVPIVCCTNTLSEALVIIIKRCLNILILMRRNCNVSIV